MATEMQQVVEESSAQAEQASESVKDAADMTQKNSVSAKVIQAAKDVQESIEKSPVATKVKQAVKDTAESVHNSQVAEMSHKVMLAGLGVVALAQDELADVVHRWIERGEIAEADGKKALKDVWDKRSRVVEIPTEMPKRLSQDLEKRMEEILAKMNIPTKDEIEALGAKITALTKKVDELKKSA